MQARGVRAPQLVAGGVAFGCPVEAVVPDPAAGVAGGGGGEDGAVRYAGHRDAIGGRVDTAAVGGIACADAVAVCAVALVAARLALRVS